MKTEDKVTSRPLSKRMVELGWNYETERYWGKYLDNPCSEIRVRKLCEGLLTEDDLLDDIIIKEKIFAPDAIEIEKVLPLFIEKDGRKYFLFYERHYTGQKQIGYHTDDSFSFIGGKTDYTQKGHLLDNRISMGNLSEALGEIWCCLTEKGLI